MIIMFVVETFKMGYAARGGISEISQGQFQKWLCGY